MNMFLFIYFMAGTITCAKSSQNSYDVQHSMSIQKPFNVFWNVPTSNCKKHNISFNGLYDKYGIIQNENDSFLGEKISILYNPGNFPGIVENIGVNGIVPQEGNLLNHLQKFKEDVEQAIPDKNFKGVGIIDFENWRPILRQNIGTMEHIRVLALLLEKIEHWWWPKQWIYKEAQRRFESSARSFLQTSLILAKKLRPKAIWGYYGFPECFNQLFSEPEKCLDQIPQENDKLSWLWSESSVLLPSVYTFEADATPALLSKFISARIKEAARVKNKGTILPYFWFRYKDGKNFKQDDLEAALGAFYNSDASGFIIWGGYKDVINQSLCLQLKDYVTTVMGPTIAKYTKPLLNNNKKITIKPESPPELEQKHVLGMTEVDNQYIEGIVIEELKRQKTMKNYGKGSALVDVILEKIAGFCVNNSCDNMRNGSWEAPVDVNSKSLIAKASMSTTTATPENLTSQTLNTNPVPTSITPASIQSVNSTVRTAYFRNILRAFNRNTCRNTKPSSQAYTAFDTTSSTTESNQNNFRKEHSRSINTDQETTTRQYLPLKKGEISTFCQQ